MSTSEEDIDLLTEDSLDAAPPSLFPNSFMNSGYPPSHLPTSSTNYNPYATHNALPLMINETFAAISNPVFSINPNEINPSMQDQSSSSPTSSSSRSSTTNSQQQEAPKRKRGRPAKKEREETTASSNTQSSNPLHSSYEDLPDTDVGLNNIPNTLTFNIHGGPGSGSGKKRGRPPGKPNKKSSSKSSSKDDVSSSGSNSPSPSIGVNKNNSNSNSNSQFTISHQQQMAQLTSAFSIVPNNSSNSNSIGDNNNNNKLKNSGNTNFYSKEETEENSLITPSPQSPFVGIGRPGSPFNKNSPTGNNNTMSPNIHLPLSSGSFTLGSSQFTPIMNPLLPMGSFVGNDVMQQVVGGNGNGNRGGSPVPHYFTLGNIPNSNNPSSNNVNNGRNSPVVIGGSGPSTPVMGSNPHASGSGTFTSIQLMDNRSPSPTTFLYQRAPSPSTIFLPIGTNMNNNPNGSNINSNVNSSIVTPSVVRASSPSLVRSNSPTRFEFAVNPTTTPLMNSSSAFKSNNSMGNLPSSNSNSNNSGSRPSSPFIPDSPTMGSPNSTAFSPTGAPVVKRGRGRPRKNSLPPNSSPQLPDIGGGSGGSGSGRSSPSLHGAGANEATMGIASPSISTASSTINLNSSSSNANALGTVSSPKQHSIHHQMERHHQSGSPRLSKQLMGSGSNASNAPLITTLRFPKKHHVSVSSAATTSTTSHSFSSTTMTLNSMLSPISSPTDSPPRKYQSPTHQQQSSMMTASSPQTPIVTNSNSNNTVNVNNVKRVLPSDTDLIGGIRNLIQALKEEQPTSIDSQEELVSILEQHFGVALMHRRAYISEVYDLLCY